jgi:hypothetical protein
VVIVIKIEPCVLNIIYNSWEVGLGSKPLRMRNRFTIPERALVSVGELAVKKLNQFTPGSVILLPCGRHLDQEVVATNCSLVKYLH